MGSLIEKSDERTKTKNQPERGRVNQLACQLLNSMWLYSIVIRFNSIHIEVTWVENQCWFLHYRIFWVKPHDEGLLSQG